MHLSEYPTTPPFWLPSWPPHGAVQEMFSDGIRRYAFGVLRKSRRIRISWTDTELIVEMDSQKAVWRLLPDGWRTRCTCGYPNGRCAHAFGAALLFREILRRENWLHAGGNVPARGERTPQADSARKKPGKPPAMEQQPLFGAQIRMAPGTAKRLEAEVDFRHEPGRAVLRFYLNESGRRRLLRMQQLVNLALGIRHSVALSRGFGEEDREFLNWLGRELRGRREVRMNLSVIKLRESEFRFWLERWSGQAGRFIDRAEQKPVSLGRQAARIRFRLTRDSLRARLEAVLVGADRAVRPLHEVLREFAFGRGRFVLDGQLTDLESPIPRETLFEQFGRGPVVFPWEELPRRLPALISGRFDLLEGPDVRRMESPGTPEVTVRVTGARIELIPAVDGVPVRGGGSPVEIRVKAGRCRVMTHTAPEMEAVLRSITALPAVSRAGEAFVLPATPAGMAAVLEMREKSPPRVVWHVARELEPLLRGAAEVRPEEVLRDRGAYMEFELVWRIRGGACVPSAEVRRALRANTPVVHAGGSWFLLDAAAAARALAELTAAGLDPFRPERLLRPDCRRVLAHLKSTRVVDADGRPLGERLRLEEPLERLTLPAALSGVLRPYQTAGFDFLAERVRWGVGAILADDMGLGKTLQVLAVLAALVESGKGKSPGARGAPADRGPLVICPASVVSVWAEHVRRFLPGHTVALYTGPASRRRTLLEQGGWDFLVVNYALVRNDIEHFRRYTFAAVVLDEAQQIKNPDAQITGAVKSLRTPQRLALTGTPLENRLLDLWSIMDFLNPGYLGERRDFLDRYGGESGRENLAHRLAPVLLRRTKEEVAPELPPRTEEVLRIELSPGQQALYTRELLRARRSLAEKGPMEVLAALTRLRQICCHPGLVDPDAGDAESAKLEVLAEMLEELVSEGHSALVFSQFTRMLARIGDRLESMGIPALTLTGETPTARRGVLVEQFNTAREAGVFLLSLRAAGTGLNLTRADYVFLYDPWWNPAVEAQAVDRAHRIGQKHPVIAYRLVTVGTVEEKVLELQREKAELFSAVVEGAAGARAAARLTAADLAGLLE